MEISDRSLTEFRRELFNSCLFNRLHLAFHETVNSGGRNAQDEGKRREEATERGTRKAGEAEEGNGCEEGAGTVGKREEDASTAEGGTGTQTQTAGWLFVDLFERLHIFSEMIPIGNH